MLIDYPEPQRSQILDYLFKPGYVPVTGVGYALFNHNSGLALNISGESTVDGGMAIQWPYHGGANKKWALRG